MRSRPHSRAFRIDQLQRRRDRRASALRLCARVLRCRRKAGGYSCSRASRTICCSAPRRCAAARRVCSRPFGARLRGLPKLKERRAQRAGRHVRRRAADAGGRPRLDGDKAVDAGRAVARPCANGELWIHVRDVWPSAPGRADHPSGRAVDQLALEVSDFATVLQVGKSVLSGTAASLAQDPQVQKAYLGA